MIEYLREQIENTESLLADDPIFPSWVNAWEGDKNSKGVFSALLKATREEAHTYLGAISDYLNLGGDTEEEKVELLIAAIEELKRKIGIPKTIKEFGVSEKKFYSSLDEMSEQAFDDQCTGANPRYPLISELKQLYINAFEDAKEE
jgi:alcohol dehydrogenase class IV